MLNYDITENYLINAILEQIIKWSEANPLISALALVGSYAIREATPDSDIDLMLITSVPEFFREYDDWLYKINWESINCKILKWNDAEYGVVWSRHIDLSYLNDLNNDFSKRIKVEISFGLPTWASINPIDSGTFDVVCKGCKILYDPQRMITNLISQING